MPAHGGERSGGRRPADLPPALDGLLRRLGSRLRNLHQPDLVPELSRQGHLLKGTLNRAMPESVQRHLHVGLPAAKPDLTDEDITQGDGAVLVGDGD